MIILLKKQHIFITKLVFRTIWFYSTMFKWTWLPSRCLPKMDQVKKMFHIDQISIPSFVIGKLYLKYILRIFWKDWKTFSFSSFRYNPYFDIPIKTFEQVKSLFFAYKSGPSQLIQIKIRTEKAVKLGILNEDGFQKLQILSDRGLYLWFLT